MKIILLPESWARRIAAGEVVERPASVVKELVENALDAGAKEVSVWLEGSGISLIRVSDDGEGIAAGELSLALKRHATSKLRDESELFRISTLGFRGEALPAIASVSRLEIVSRPRGEDMGARLKVEGGEEEGPQAAGCPVGTTVEVRDLFFNTPARRKFLKSPGTELGHVSDVINRVALAYGSAHFRLYHGGRMLCDYAAVSEPGDRLRQVLGGETADGMAPFSWTRGKMKFTGFLSSAPSSFSSSRYLWTYVNRRFVRDRIVNHAVLQGYETLVMKGRYPAVVLCLELPFEEVDVNVHPAKHEIRFRHQSEVHDAVTEAVREKLKEKAREPAPGMVAGRADPFLGVAERPPPYSYPMEARELPLKRVDSSGSEGTKGGEQARQGFFASLEILGQLLGCYLVCASRRGMALIDQHAAHERVAFERMRHQLAREGAPRQNLLMPQILELPHAETLLLEQMLDLVGRLGFFIEEFGPNTFAIKAVPALLPAGDYRDAIRRMVAELAEIGRSEELRQGLEERLMTIACHNVIRANRRLAKEEIQALLRDLDQIDFATQCPHGRPVLIEFSQAELERMFHR